MYLRKARALLLGAVMAVGAVGPLAAETLGDALIAAYRNSNLLDQNRALLRAADEGVAQAVATLRPVVDFVVRSTYVYNQQRPSLLNPARVNEGLSLSVGLSAQLTLYDGGANKLGIAAAKEQVLATRQGLIGVEHQVLFSAVQAYMQLRLSEDVVALRQGNVRVLTRELEAAQDRFDLGEITRTDVAIAEARLAASRAQLSAAEGNVLVNRETYELAVGKRPGRLSNPPRPPVTANSVDEAKRIARAQHYAIKQRQHELTAAELNVQRSSVSMGPRVAAEASVGKGNTGLTTNSVSIGLSQRLYQGGGQLSVYRAAVARRDAARAALQQTVAEVEQAVGEAWAQRSVSRTSITATDRQIVAARTAYDGVREEATLGARTTLDVLNAEQELLDAQAERLTAVTNEYLAAYGLLAAMGYLTVDHLKLGIATYDVTGYYDLVKKAPGLHNSVQGERLDRVLQSLGKK